MAFRQFQLLLNKDNPPCAGGEAPVTVPFAGNTVVQAGATYGVGGAGVSYVQPGTDQWERIEPEIRASTAISIIWTSHTDWGSGVQREIILARQYSIPEMLLIEEQLELPESHRGTNVEYQRFDADDPAQPFSKMLTTRRAIVLDQIRRRAYELYEARGREDGHELQDWLRAQAEVTAARA